MVTVKEWNQTLFDATDISTTEFAVGIAIGSFANWHTGDSCFPSQERISDRSKASLTTVKRATKALVEKGYLTKIRPERFQGNNQYILRIPPRNAEGPGRTASGAGVGPESGQLEPSEGREVASTYSSTHSGTSLDTSSSSQESRKEIQGVDPWTIPGAMPHASGAKGQAPSPGPLEPPLSPTQGASCDTSKNARVVDADSSTTSTYVLHHSSQEEGAPASKEEDAPAAREDVAQNPLQHQRNRFSAPGVRCVGESDRRHAKRLLGPQNDYSWWLEREYPVDHSERDFGEMCVRLAESPSFMPKDRNPRVRLAMAESELRKRGPYRFRTTWHGPPTPRRLAAAP